MTGVGGAHTPAIKAFPGGRPVSCSALTSIVSATRPVQPRPTRLLVASAQRLPRSSPLRSPAPGPQCLPQISSGLPRAPASLSPTQELPLSALRTRDPGALTTVLTTETCLWVSFRKAREYLRAAMCG